MKKLSNIDDTIAAISTPMGAGGGIGIIRLSGKKALAIAEKIFVPENKCKLSKVKSHTVHYGTIVDKKKKNSMVDEALINVMLAPRTYTKEDVVEINCHGSNVALRSILSLVIDCGARLAEPGEFTKRAFLNGRIDLTQAEAVLDIIQAKTEAFLRLSTNQLKGDLTLKLEEIREDLMNIYTELEAAVNFPDEDIETKGYGKLFDLFDIAQKKIKDLLDSSEQGKILKEGIRVVICGKPNVGKSSLLNVFLKTPRAIISEIPGTTRDTIEEMIQIKGIPLHLVDTAGILEPQNIIEEEAIGRSQLYMRSADIILLVLDGSQVLSQEDMDLIKEITEQTAIVVINKCDLELKLEEAKIKSLITGKKVTCISALENEGIEELKEMVVDSVSQSGSIDTSGILLSNMRHICALKNAADSLANGLDLLKQNLSQEFVCEEVKTSISFLDTITGRDIDADLLDNIFSRFCIGK